MSVQTIQNLSRVSRRGNSLWVRIPDEGADKLNLKAGESVQMRVSADTITIRRAKPRKKWTEEELLVGITPEICGPDLTFWPAAHG